MGYLDRLFAPTERGTDNSVADETSVVWGTALADSANGYVLVQIGQPIEDSDALDEGGLDATIEVDVGSYGEESTVGSIGDDYDAEVAGSADAGIEDTGTWVYYYGSEANTSGEVIDA